MSNKFAGVGYLLIAAVLAGCGKQPSAPPDSPFKLSAGVQDIMAHMIGPAADAVWGSVGTTETDKGVENHLPQSEQEWLDVRGHAVTLMESANLLLMKDRAVAMPGRVLLHGGTPGNLTAEEVQAAINLDRTTFVAFAQALHAAGAQLVSAADAKNPQSVVDAGDALYQVCAGCHSKFWYPGEQVPRFPDQAPEVDAR